MSNISRFYRDPNEISDLQKKVATKGSPPIQHKAVVIDVILDPLNLTSDQANIIKNITQKNKNLTSLAEMMPINTVIGKIVSHQGGQDAKSNIIILPWISSHILMPVKPGEIINVIYDDFENTGGQMPFWISRRHAPGSVEDVNYTHYDRIYDASHNPENYKLADRDKTENNTEGPGFPNGGGTNRSQTINNNDNEDAYEKIVNQASAYQLYTPEPVPRFRKKPGDLTLQGSNNTLINLGEDRNGSIDNEDNIINFAGTIDIVAGRGRIMPKSSAEEPKGTSPRVVKNTRGNFETDKAPFRQGFNTNKHNPQEGDPDFINDAARIYVSMQTEADRKFELQLNRSGQDPDGSPELPNINNKQGSVGRSHVVAKADHIRLIARNSEDPNVKGTVLLIREGEPNQDLGYFYINEQGNIFIEGEKIYNGEATSETEPAILYTNYQQTILALQEQIDNLVAILDSAFSTATSPTGPLTYPGMKNSNGTVNAANITTGTAIVSSNKSNKQTVEDNTQSSRHSKKTFHEPNDSK